MSKQLVEIKGFQELQRKIKSLSNDKVKKREVLKILGQVANPTVKAAKALAPVGSGFVTVNGKSYARTKRQVGKRSYGAYVAGVARKSIGKKNMRRSKNAILYVSPRSTKKTDGFHARQFVLRGTKNQDSNPFIDKAYDQTKGGVTKDAEVRMARYIQKQINRLSNA
jgi:HK97 gp10 family phage protein|tara:strand:- start:139 stop:639 length:501 start_codon:yes stop_codon:yes gene_type:complete